MVGNVFAKTVLSWKTLGVENASFAQNEAVGR